jgi:shikimate dehydrogenase
MKDLYAVFGNPIAHSKSPLIHTEFAKQTGQNIEYTRQLVESGQFNSAAKKFFDQGGKGLNITVPFKLDAFQFADTLNERARLAGAVNTLKKLADGKIFGDNTDGCGLVRDITQNLKWTIKNKSILILGAGGAVRGVLGPLLAEKPAQIVIANRTVEKAVELMHVFNSPAIRGCGYDAIEPATFDLIINGTSASLSGELPSIHTNGLSATTNCYDMMYSKNPTVFMQWASGYGSEHVSDGLGMLVEQAAESFYIWRGVRPATRPVIAKVRSEL